MEIFDSWTHLTPVQLDDPEQVWTAFSKYFEPKTNYRLARYQLRDIKQNSNEPVDSYISRLRTQAKKCNYLPDALEDMLIDQFIVGVAHDSVRKHILDKKPDKLTLDMCLQFTRTHEATASQFGQFQSSSVTSVKHTSKCSSHHKDLHKSSRSWRSRSKSLKKKSCVWCGGEQHDRANCPAADSQWSKCKKLGHWSQACLTTKYSQAKYSSQQHQSKRQQPQPRQRAVHETQENLTPEFEELTSMRSRLLLMALKLMLKSGLKLIPADQHIFMEKLTQVHKATFYLFVHIHRSTRSAYVTINPSTRLHQKLCSPLAMSLQSNNMDT